MSFTEFQNTIIQKLGLYCVKQVEKLFYRIPIFVTYDSFVIDSDEDLQFSEVRTPELLAKLVYVVCSSEDSNQNPQSSTIPAASGSMPLGASSFVHVIALETVLDTSPFFAADLNCNCDRKIGDNRPFGELVIMMAGTPIMVPIFEAGGASDGVEDVLRDDDNDDDDDDDDDVELTTIADDSDDDIAGVFQVAVVEHLVQELSSTPALFNFGR
ncbi:hypothetical protein Ahy_B04g073352 [Arachis hypogaea]|uniref:Uncharacterized protein n=1 Tax=Arachis hypogaea TaxID=3818 RepID=A0A444ZQF1_ARAHY|nr:hypothetical protein Ahy_B04g073352 [Arachis hypogaea]